MFWGLLLMFFDLFLFYGHLFLFLGLLIGNGRISCMGLNHFSLSWNSIGNICRELHGISSNDIFITHFASKMMILMRTIEIIRLLHRS